MRSGSVFAGLGMLVWLAACTAPQQSAPPVAPQPAPPPTSLPATPPPGPIKVGLLLPLSGSAAAIGADMLDAAQLALFDVGDTDLVLLPRDTGDSPQGAVEAARDAIANGAQLLLGPLFGPSTAAVAPVAAAADVRVLSFSNDASVAGRGVWVMGFRPEEQVERVVSYAHSRGFGRVAALVPDDAYGRRALDAWQLASSGSAGGAGPVGIYPPDGSDPSPVIRELTRYDERAQARPVAPIMPGIPSPPLEAPQPSGAFDALLLADGGLRLKTVLSLLGFYDVDPATTRILGTMRWLEDATLAGEPALRGAWLAAPSPRGIAELRRQFSDVFGREPGPLAGLAYDVTALVAVIAKTEHRFDAATLTASDGFAGRLGIFRLLPNGQAQHGLAIVEMGGNPPQTLDPAPSTFTAGYAAR